MRKVGSNGPQSSGLDSMFRGSEANLESILDSDNFALYAGDVRMLTI